MKFTSFFSFGVRHLLFGILRFAFEFSPMLAHEFLHAFCDSLHPFLAVFIGSGKGDAEAPIPVFSECSAGDHRHATMIQEVIGKR